MDSIPTISDTTQGRGNLRGTPDVCWCGQDVEHVRGAHCPRCGTARSTYVGPSLSRLAA
ncbi:hypothetical protein [Nocardioides sediminis]|uniref:hypothetical protein n=1 Tax=Nocardioides sediminis TaxID=433648 RepID=UPI00131EE169|nr:hypothetical protein [Nocardioides sediminis]